MTFNERKIALDKHSRTHDTTNHSHFLFIMRVNSPHCITSISAHAFFFTLRMCVGIIRLDKYYSLVLRRQTLYISQHRIYTLVRTTLQDVYSEWLPRIDLLPASLMCTNNLMTTLLFRPTLGRILTLSPCIYSFNSIVKPRDYIKRVLRARAPRTYTKMQKRIEIALIFALKRTLCTR